MAGDCDTAVTPAVVIGRHRPSYFSLREAYAASADSRADL